MEFSGENGFSRLLCVFGNCETTIFADFLFHPETRQVHLIEGDSIYFPALFIHSKWGNANCIAFDVEETFLRLNDACKSCLQSGRSIFLRLRIDHLHLPDVVGLLAWRCRPEKSQIHFRLMRPWKRRKDSEKWDHEITYGLLCLDSRSIERRLLLLLR